jgi:dGTPase
MVDPHMVSNGHSIWAFPDAEAARTRPLKDETTGTSFRTKFARDRDRILYSQSFRRLGQKTQVYLTTEANRDHDAHCRTRLTHSLEVVQTAKGIASSLRLNTDLVEAIAFGHDVGHAPFGHVGERQLDDFLNGDVPVPRQVLEKIKKRERYQNAFRSEYARDFRHNYQSVRLLTLLERYSPSERGFGLNLTYPTLAGILRHTRTTPIRGNGDKAKYPAAREIPFENLLGDPHLQSIEAQVVAIADEMAQVVHDLCDAMTLGVVTLQDLYSDNSPTHSVVEKSRIDATYMNKEVDFSLTAGTDELVAQLCSILVHYFATNTARRIGEFLTDIPKREGQQVSDVCGRIGVLPYPREEFDVLRRFRDDLIVNNFHVNRMDNRGCYFIRQLIKSGSLPNSVRVTGTPHSNGRCSRYTSTWSGSRTPDD